MTGTKLLILILRRGASKFRFDKSSNFLFIHLLVSVTSCLRGRPKWLQYYMGGSLGNPKSDYVIHEQPLILACVRVKSIISFSCKKIFSLTLFQCCENTTWHVNTFQMISQCAARNTSNHAINDRVMKHFSDFKRIISQICIGSLFCKICMHQTTPNQTEVF